MLYNELRGKSKSEVYDILSRRTDLSRDEKNKLWVRLFPDPVHHMELPELIKELRESPTYNRDRETLLLLRAYSHVQYHRFIRHLLHSYIKDVSKIYKVEELGSRCAICDCELPSGYSSTDTNLDLCLVCIGQLKSLDEDLRWMEGVNYLEFFEK